MTESYRSGTGYSTVHGTTQAPLKAAAALHTLADDGLICFSHEASDCPERVERENEKDSAKFIIHVGCKPSQSSISVQLCSNLRYVISSPPIVTRPRGVR